MISRINLTWLIALLCVAPSHGQSPTSVDPATGTPPPGMRGSPLNLPDISVIGTIKGNLSDDQSDPHRNELSVDEVEVSFQGYLYPELRADVYLAFHEHDSETKAEVEEAKISFLQLFEGMSGLIGKTRMEFGKLNPLHPHQWGMVDQPPAITHFFGDHGFMGQGASFSYLLPLPFFFQVGAGAWTNTPEEEETEFQTIEVFDTGGNPVSVLVEVESSDREFELADKIYTGRVKSSFTPHSKSEFELGSSFAHGRGTEFEEHKDNATVWGADLTLRWWPSAYRRFIFQNEYFHLQRKLPTGPLYRDGLYSYMSYKFNKWISLGGRWDYAEGAFPTKTIERNLSAMGSLALTETTIFRIQYKRKRAEQTTVNEGWLQIIFGIGPHSHVLE